jgi:hypothetical protein
MRSLHDYTNEELINALIAAGYDASEISDDDIETAVENLSENPSGFGPDAYRNTVIQYIESHTGRAQGLKKRGKNRKTRGKRSRKTRGNRSRKTKRSRK